MKKLTTRQIALNGVVAGLYAAVTILTASFAYGNIQFRIADALCVLVVLDDASLDHPQELSVRARLERAAYLADDRNLTAKFVAGEKILG